MSRPDFMIIGAMKCGTSTLQTQLAAQDGVFMTTPKEPNFFSNDDIYAKGLSWYDALYDAAAEDALTGEASTHYTKLPTYPQTLTRLQNAISPLPKVIYVIRNPVERAISHYIHEWTEARMNKDPDSEFANHPEMIDYGLYGTQITPYIQAFGAQKVFLTSLEQIKADASFEFRRITDFLGLPEEAAWQDTISAQNVSTQRARKLPLQQLLIDNPAARFLRQTFVPKSLRSYVRSKLTMRDRPELPDTLITHLETRFLEDRKILAEFFPDHPALDLCYPFHKS